mgnify:CR=1 FL=1
MSETAKEWRKRLDEFDGDDEGVIAQYRQFVKLCRCGHLADMLHEDGMINDLITDCDNEDHRLGKRVQEYVDDIIEHCMGKHMWWDAFTIWINSKIEYAQLNAG